MTVRTTPPGASVYIDKQYIGNSPASSSYIYYGTREIEVARDGFRSEKVLRRISPPWYQWPPLDFISETLWPWEVRDERIIDISMVPSQAPPSDVLQADAERFRLQASQGLATPLPPTMQPGADFRTESGILGGTNPVQPIDPTYQGLPQSNVLPVPSPGPTWQPGQILGNIIMPGGQPPQSIPETGILPGGGYRPEMP